MVEFALNIGLPVLLLVIAIWFGGRTERKHIKRLDEAEANLRRTMQITNSKHIADPDSVEESVMVCGQVVIATDYFKTFATSLRNFVGGEMKSAGKLMMRARREALLRAAEEAQARGATELHNVRFCFSRINQMSGKRGAMQAELMAYGTAVRRRPDATPTAVA